MAEELVMMRALKDMNLCKLIDADVKLFHGLFQDLFPNVEQANPEYGILQETIHNEITKMGLQIKDSLVKKVIQVYEALQTRHGNMIVGETDTGKTTAWKVLKNTLDTLAKKNIPGYYGAEYHILNPKAITMEQLYGYFDSVTREWKDGVLSVLLRKIAENDSPTWKWLVLDGPVDTLWIESMNTVLDDNKVLTLINGDRISLSPQSFLLFEVQNLSVASPATVSRVGIVYFDEQTLGWNPFVKTWIASKEISQILGSDGSESITKLFDTYVTELLEFKSKNCKELVPINDFNAVQSLCRMLSCVLTLENGIDKKDDVNLSKMIEYWFIFCLVWTVGAGVVEEDRQKIDSFIRKTEATLPPLNTVYDYYVNVHKKEWGFWQEKLSDDWRPLPNTQFHNILVPTTDTIRNNYVMNILQLNKFPTLATGSTGTGKTAVVNNMLNQMNKNKDITLTINFSSATNAETVQRLLDARLVKHHGDTFVPGICFVLNINNITYGTV